MSDLVLSYSWVLFAAIMTTTLILIIIKTTNEEEKKIKEKLEESLEFFPVNISVLIVSDSRTKDTDISGNLLINSSQNDSFDTFNTSSAVASSLAYLILFSIVSSNKVVS